MHEFIHKQSQKLFRSDAGIWLGSATVFAWTAHQLTTHQTISLEGFVTLLDFLALFFCRTLAWSGNESNEPEA